MTLPTPAQAKELAYLWSSRGRREVHYLPGTIRTDDVLVREGWLHDTGARGVFPSGAEYAVYVLAPAGVDALKRYMGTL